VAEQIDDSLAPIAQVRQLMEILRGPRGCDWDKAQTFATIAPYTIEEAYEVKEAIDRADMDEFKAELGDLLFQVIFQSRIAEEDGLFDFDAVCAGLVGKMVTRHPHVFGDADKLDWEAAKEAERNADPNARTLDGVALALPALMRAQKLGKRASKVGFDWPDAEPVAAKVREELDELAAAKTLEDKHEELGDLLFAVVNLARHEGVDAEAALRDANTKFQRRFEEVEERLGDSLSDASIETMEAAWDAAKRSGL
jgi:ATP diphosphatase